MTSPQNKNIEIIREKRYQIMFDYGASEGYTLQEEKFETIDQAVKHAVAMNYSTPFIIVEIVWKPDLLA